MSGTVLDIFTPSHSPNYLLHFVLKPFFTCDCSTSAQTGMVRTSIPLTLITSGHCLSKADIAIHSLGCGRFFCVSGP